MSKDDFGSVSIKAGSRIIGDSHPVFIIAEAGANFRISDNPEVNRRHAFEMIDIAVDAKADAVKFQLYRAERMYVGNAGYADYIGKKKSIYQIIEEMELPYEWLQEMKNYCDSKGIMFLCTPFDERSTDELEAIGMEAYKIASYTITHIPLLKHIARKNKPIILSTGASSDEDIEKAISAIREEGNDDIALMQCTAKYPAPLSTINLRVIPTLKKMFGVPVGLSDHSRTPYIAPLGAVSLGASIIEKHYTTDNSLPGPDHGFAILDTELKELVENIRMLEAALGTADKHVLGAEDELHQFCRRRIYATKDIAAGEAFSPDNIAVLRSGKQHPGLEPEHYPDVIGKKAKNALLRDSPVTMEDVE